MPGAVTLPTPALPSWHTWRALLQQELAGRAGVGVMSVHGGETHRTHGFAMKVGPKEAARRAGIARSTMYRMMVAGGISVDHSNPKMPVIEMSELVRRDEARDDRKRQDEYAAQLVALLKKERAQRVQLLEAPVSRPTLWQRLTGTKAN